MQNFRNNVIVRTKLIEKFSFYFFQKFHLLVVHFNLPCKQRKYVLCIFRKGLKKFLHTIQRIVCRFYIIVHVCYRIANRRNSIIFGNFNPLHYANMMQILNYRAQIFKRTIHAVGPLCNALTCKFQIPLRILKINEFLKNHRKFRLNTFNCKKHAFRIIFSFSQKSLQKGLSFFFDWSKHFWNFFPVAVKNFCNFIQMPYNIIKNRLRNLQKLNIETHIIQNFFNALLIFIDFRKILQTEKNMLQCLPDNILKLQSLHRLLNWKINICSQIWHTVQCFWRIFYQCQKTFRGTCSQYWKFFLTVQHSLYDIFQIGNISQEFIFFCAINAEHDFQLLICILKHLIRKSL